MINQKELRSLLIILRDSFKQIFGDQFERMILYGSRARGDHRLDSDIDILIVLKGDFNAFDATERTSETVARLSLENDILISRTFISSEKYHNGQSPFLRNVQREGISI